MWIRKCPMIRFLNKLSRKDGYYHPIQIPLALKFGFDIGWRNNMKKKIQAQEDQYHRIEADKT